MNQDQRRGQNVMSGERRTGGKEEPLLSKQNNISNKQACDDISWPEGAELFEHERLSLYQAAKKPRPWGGEDVGKLG